MIFNRDASVVFVGVEIFINSIKHGGVIRKSVLKINTMDNKSKVLETMKKAGEPLNAGKIAELSGLDRKEVDKAMKDLKEEGQIVSPVRCKWAPAN